MNRNNMVALELYRARRLKAILGPSLIAMGVGLAGCQKDVGAESQNNGSLAKLSTPRSKVTGSLIIRNASATALTPDARCKLPPSGASEFYIRECRYFQTCTATVARLEGVGAPFIVSAAHCDPAELLSRNFSAKKAESGSQATSASTPTAGSAALFFYQPSTQTWLTLKRWVGHEKFNKDKPVVDFISKDVNYDISVAEIEKKEQLKVRIAASILTKIPNIRPPDSVTAAFGKDVDGKGATDALTHFTTTFDRAAFDTFPQADLYGFGHINNGTGMAADVDLAPTKKTCEQREGEWTGNFCTRYSMAGKISNTRFETDLRYINMRLAFSDLQRGIAVFLAPSSFPRGGTCQGDSGGPAFLGREGTELFAVESGGPFPCAGSPTIRTIVATHVDWMRDTLR